MPAVLNLGTTAPDTSDPAFSVLKHCLRISHPSAQLRWNTLDTSEQFLCGFTDDERLLFNIERKNDGWIVSDYSHGDRSEPGIEAPTAAMCATRLVAFLADQAETAAEEMRAQAEAIRALASAGGGLPRVA